jgi:lysophosphatidic acid acyltransferase/lysophosphatidylinositol acyltransferase
MKIAQEKGLPELKHHLLPRTKGFTLLLQGAEDRSMKNFFSFLAQISSLVTGIYDLTIGFKKTGADPTLLSVLKGRSCQAEMFLRRIPISDIPKDTEGCGNWVHDLYRQKDQIYDYFLRHDTFEGNGFIRLEIPRNSFDLFIELAWMFLLGVPSIIYLFHFFWISSFFVQIIFIILIFLGKSTNFPDKNKSFSL